METAPIPYAASLASGVEELAGGTPVAVNVLVDDGGAIRQRPGIAAYQGGTGVASITGITIWNNYVVYVTSDRKLHAFTAPNTTYELSDSTTTTQLDGTLRPIFAETKNMLIVVGGGAPQKWDGVGLSARLGGSPPAATHVAAIAQRIVLNQYGPTGQFQWSALGTEETWPAANYAEAEARPDQIRAIHDNARELYIFGSETTQVYNVSPDPLLPYASAATLNNGCVAPYSVIQVDEGFAWMDDRRRFILSGGREVEVLSGPIAKTLAGLATVSDAWGFRARIDQYDLIVWVFPTEGRAFAYESNGKRWAEWRGYSNGAYAALPIGAYANWTEQNLHLVGDLGGSGIAKLSMTAGSDLGAILKGEVQTGVCDYKQSKRKSCQRVDYILRRGSTASSSMEVRHRNDLGDWTGWRPLSLGSAGDYNVVVPDWGAMGVYRVREHHFRYSGTDVFSMASARELFAPLDD